MYVEDGVMSFKVSRKYEILKNVSMAFDEFLTIELISLKVYRNDILEIYLCIFIRMCLYIVFFEIPQALQISSTVTHIPKVLKLNLLFNYV